jgi:hypothetical protein
MKTRCPLVAIFILSVASTGFGAPHRESDSSSFSALEVRREEFTINGIQFFSIARVSPTLALAFGYDSVSAPSLYAIELPSRRILFASEEVSGGYETHLYQYRTVEQIIILWEIGTEFSALLDCFRIDLEIDDFSYVGKFDVSLPYSVNNENDCSFPVSRIGIASNDSGLAFRFPQSVVYRPYEEDHVVVDSVLYRLNKVGGRLELAYPQK